MLSSASTFDDLCLHSTYFLNNQSERSPFYLKSDKPFTTPLYEGTNEFKQVIIELNRLKYFTKVSQPGISEHVRPYSSLYHRVNKIDQYLPGEYTRRQRACVKGFMKIEMSMYLYEKLKDDKNLFLSIEFTTDSSSKFHLVPDVDVDYASVIFDSNNIPLISKRDTYKIGDDYKNVPDADESMLVNAVGKTFEWFINTNKEIYPNVDVEWISDKRVARFDVTAVEWNDDTYLWKTLVGVLEEYTNITHQ